MANKMLRVEYNLKGNSCKIKAFKELRGWRKPIKDVGTYYGFCLKWSVRSAYESGTVFWDIKKSNKTQQYVILSRWRGNKTANG